MNIDPVTEAEVHSFLSRISNLIVANSSANQEIKQLREDFTVANDRIARLEQDNAKVSRELADTWQLVKSLEDERDRAKAETEVAVSQRREVEERLSQAHDALLQRDARIAELEQQVAALTQTVEAKDRRIASVETDVRHLNHNRDYWRQRCNEVENTAHRQSERISALAQEASDLRNKLAVVQGKLEDLHKVFAPAVEEQQEKTPENVNVWPPAAAAQ